MSINKKEDNFDINKGIYGKGDPTWPNILSTENINNTTEHDYGKNTPNTPFYENKEYQTYPLSPSILNNGATSKNPIFPNSQAPDFIPNKTNSKVQTFNKKCIDIKNTKDIVDEISICMFTHIYLWLRNSVEFWAYIMRIDISTISGYKWIDSSWIYFDLPLYKIDSILCFNREDGHSDCDEIYSKDYRLNSVMEIITYPLITIEIPESKDEIISIISESNNNCFRKKCHCLKKRDHNYNISIQISFPENLDTHNKDLLISYSNSAYKKTFNITIDGKLTRGNIPLNPLEKYNSVVSKIDKALNIFVEELTKDLKKLPDFKKLESLLEIKIVREKRTSKWTSE